MIYTFAKNQKYKLANGAEFLITKIEGNMVSSMSLPNGKVEYRDSIDELIGFFVEQSATLISDVSSKLPQIITSRKFNSLQSADRYAIVIGDETIADNLPSMDVARQYLANCPELFPTSLETLRPNRKSMTLTPFVDDNGEFIGVYFKIGDAQGNVIFEGTKCIIDDYNEFFTKDMTNRILSASKRYLGLTKIRKFTAERIRNSYYNNGLIERTEAW